MIQDSEMVGKKYGMLTVLKRSHKNKESRWAWLCLCKCGNTRTAFKNQLDFGWPKSCGCLVNPGSTKHLMTKTKEFKTWSSIKIRCYNKTAKDYDRYGGRGIMVCSEWINSFEQFFNDMGYAPTAKHEIDRRDNNGNYTAYNCHWVTRLENSCNRRDSMIWHVKGLIFDSATKAAKHFGVSDVTIHRWCKGHGRTIRKHDCNCERRYK